MTDKDSQAIVTGSLSEDEARTLAMVENLHRRGYNTLQPRHTSHVPLVEQELNATDGLVIAMGARDVPLASPELHNVLRGIHEGRMIHIQYDVDYDLFFNQDFDRFFNHPYAPSRALAEEKLKPEWQKRRDRSKEAKALLIQKLLERKARK
jgi:hypothetical protein